MFRRIGLHGLVLFHFVLSSCLSAVQAQAHAANAVALAANRALPVLVSTFQDEGLTRIRQAPDREHALAELAAVRERWRPALGECTGEPVVCRGGAWEAARVAHDAWARLLEREIDGEHPDAAEVAGAAARLRVSYCALRLALPASERGRLPDVPIASCDRP